MDQRCEFGKFFVSVAREPLEIERLRTRIEKSARAHALEIGDIARAKIVATWIEERLELKDRNRVARSEQRIGEDPVLGEPPPNCEPLSRSKRVPDRGRERILRTAVLIIVEIVAEPILVRPYERALRDHARHDERECEGASTQAGIRRERAREQRECDGGGTGGGHDREEQIVRRGMMW